MRGGSLPVKFPSMPRTRQPSDLPPTYPTGAPHSASWIPDGCHIGLHRHIQGQLIYPASGAMSTTTERGTWVAPTNRATWTPPGFDHSHRVYGRTNVRIVVIPNELSGDLPPHPSVFAVKPLLREAILALTNRTDMRQGAYERLRAVMIDELVEAPQQSLHLPEPRDDRLRTITDLLHADPARGDTLSELGRTAGASERTLSRLFQSEFGMSFQRWRTTLRIHRALALLNTGWSVTDTASECGWSNPTSLIEAFTALVGQTPGQYVAELAADRASHGHGNSEPTSDADLA